MVASTRNSAEAFASRRRVGSGRSALPWIIAPWLGLVPLSCGDARGVGQGGVHGIDPSGSSQQAIYGGVQDNDAQANEAVVALRIGNGATFVLCSGSLIAPNVVLTARHCVSQIVTTSVNCDQNGQSLNGNQVGADLDPTTIHVFTGPQPNLDGNSAANGKAIFHPPGNTICNSDVGVLVLDAVVTGVVPLRVRLVNPTKTSDVVRAVGYGQTDQSTLLGTRFRKDQVALLAMGPVVSSSNTPLASSEFEVGLSTCEGDSGGPAISEATGAIIGVGSRSGPCTDGFGHVYTETQAFSSLFQQAFTVATGSVTEENSPPPLAAQPDAGPPEDAGDASPPPPPQAGPTTGPSGPLNLHAGAGAGCSTSARPARPTSIAWLVALIGLAVLRGYAKVRSARARTRESMR